MFNVTYVTSTNPYHSVHMYCTNMSDYRRFYLPPLLAFLIMSFTQGVRSASTVRYPVWRVLLAISVLQFGTSVLNNLDVIRLLDVGKFLTFPAYKVIYLATFGVHLLLTIWYSTQTTNTIQGIQLNEINFFLLDLESNWYIHNNREIYSNVLSPTAQSVWWLRYYLNKWDIFVL